MKCKHENFAANVAVNRLEDTGRFQADVTIRCASCGTPFRFIGLPCGLDLNGAAVNPDATEARLAIAPLGEVVPMVEDAPMGFSIRREGHAAPGLLAAAKNAVNENVCQCDNQENRGHGEKCWYCQLSAEIFKAESEGQT